jgi:exodeoxyribonuclease V beta subunit
MVPFDVLDPQLNVLGYRFLEASAGTGKTFAIEHLYVRWILEGIPLREILVVTFTKAATRELIERIHNRLQMAHRAAISEEHLLLLESALASFDEAKIYTIHGFCQSMLKRFFLEAGCDTTFSTEQKLWEEWLDFLRGHLNEKEVGLKQIDRFFGHKFEIQLEALVKNWKPSIEDPLPDFSEIPRLIEEQLSKIPHLSSERVLEDLQKLQGIYTKFTRYEEQYAIVAHWCQDHRVQIKEIETIIGAESFFLEAIGTAERKKTEKPVSWHFPELIPMLQKALLPLLADVADKDKIQKKLVAKFSSYRKTRSVQSTTPDELLFYMMKALEKPVFFEAVKRQFQAVVIDEFQDTDEMQWQIFDRLFMTPRTLKAFYLVGDPKQSIYAFRSADLYTYLEAKKAFYPEEQASLNINYRSKKPLVEALNTLFVEQKSEGWMPLPKLGQFIEVAAVGAKDQSMTSVMGVGSVHVTIARAQEEVFSYIAEQIAFWKREEISIKEIAILVKDRYEARKLIQFLFDRGIKSHYGAQGHLADTAAFDGLVDLLALIERPRDVGCLKRVLAGSFVAWPSEQLTEKAFDEAFPWLMSSLQQLIVVFEDKGIAACLKMFFEEPLFGLHSIAERLLHEDDMQTYEEFQQITEILVEECSLRKMNLLQMRLFLLKIKQEKRFDEETYEKRSSIEEDAVEVTTIFKSKGLEYEVVFPLALATGRTKADEDEEKIAEKMRLLYVAMTRAKRCVYLPWLIDAENQKPSITELFFASCLGSTEPQTIMEKLRDIGKSCSLSVEEIETKERNIVLDATEASILIPSPSPFTRRFAPCQITSFTSLAKSGQEEEKRDVFRSHKKELDSPSSLPPGAETGMFIHEILEEVFRHALHYPYREEKIVALVDKKTAGTSFAPFKEELVRLIDGVLTVPITPHLSSQSPFALNEIQPFSLLPEMEFVYESQGNLCKGFIDLVFFHDGLFYLADWKTNWLPEYSLQQLETSIHEKHYDLQAAIYTEALKRYLRLFDERPFETLFGGAYYLYLRGMQWIKVLP